jgi:hypothetical protein
MNPGRMAIMMAALAAQLGLMMPMDTMAHHSPSMFDFGKQSSVTGTVREFQWTNPHAYIQLTVKDAKGHEQEWSFEMGAPMYLYNHGWRPRSLKSGDVVSIKFAPLRPGSRKVHGGLAIEVSDAGGKPIGKASQVPQ